MISIRRAVAVVQFAGLGLLSDGLLRLSDQVDAEEDDKAGEELGRALDGHENRPVRGALAD